METKVEATYSHFYVGTYTRKEGHVDGVAEGVYCYKMNDQTGVISHVSTVTGLINPSFVALHPNKKWLYAAQEHGGAGDFPTGTVSSILIDPATHAMTLQNTVSAEGGAPCYVSISADGQYVLVANYVGGNIAALPIQADGTLGEATDMVKHAGENPHAHYVNTERDGNIYVADLGISQTLRYELVDGKFNLKDKYQAADGAGTRHLAFHPKLDRVYALNEWNGTVDVLNTADLSALQTISTTKDGSTDKAGSGAIRVHPNGQFLYASNRFERNNIAIYKIDQVDGKITLIGHQDVFGRTPRDFIIDPQGKFLLVANQDSRDVVTFKIKTDGTLEKVQKTEVASPVCIVFE
ncbi:MAG: lactonase family protein [Saprospiraceae bacterium]